MDQKFTLSELLRELWEFDHPVYLCFVGLERAYDHAPQRDSVWALWEYGVRSRFYELSGPSITKVRAVSTFLVLGGTHLRCVLDSTSAALCH